MLFVNGRLAQGLDVHHQAAVLQPDASGRAVIDLQGYAGMTDRRCVLHVCVAVARTDVRALYYDLLTALEAAETMDENDPARPALMNRLNEACSMLDLRVPCSPAFQAGLQNASAHLAQTVYTGSRSDVTAVCVGHSHIDVAWLWDHAQTRLKTRRTFSTVLRLMEEHPSFTFFHSTPQLFQWLKRDDPDLYEEVRHRVAEGRFELDGAMWLEADCNIPSGESLIRQIVYGKRFLRGEFGTECEVLWLPDVFGYSAALPQILAQTGIRTFVTTKISWNMGKRLRIPVEGINQLSVGIQHVHAFILPLQRQHALKNGGAVLHSLHKAERFAAFSPPQAHQRQVILRPRSGGAERGAYIGVRQRFISVRRQRRFVPCCF